MIPYGRQDIDSSDIQAVVEVLNSQFLTQGPKVVQFEKEFSIFVGCDYAVATNSATSALHLACLAIGISPGDVVWVPAISFVASANCAVYCGAQVKFIDVDPETALLSLESLEEMLKDAQESLALPKAILAVSFAGASLDMARLRAMTSHLGIKVIEDASHAVGASYPDGSGLVGSSIHSDVTIFSFHPVKIMTTGEGGMAVTNDSTIYKRLYRLRSHGITRSPEEMDDYQGPWYYEQIDLGFNYRMTDIQAALGISQLKRVKAFLEKRRSLAARYFELLGSTNLGLPDQEQLPFSSWHLFVIRPPLGSNLTRSQIMEKLSLSGFGTNVHYIPIYRHPFYRNQPGGRDVYLKGAEAYFASAVTLPLHTKMERDQVDMICRKIFETEGFQSIF